MLSDGSQAGKTGDEKELILWRVGKDELPIYFVISFLEWHILKELTRKILRQL